MAPVLLYDGDCGLCARSVQFVLRHDRRGTLRFAPLQGAFARDVLARHPSLATVDSVVWVEPAADGAAERVAVRSDAALLAVAYLGGWWSLLRAGRVMPKPLRDAVYDFVARHRHQFTRPQCLIPPPDVRHRFIDT